jgi:hypothetical protein
MQNQLFKIAKQISLVVSVLLLLFVVYTTYNLLFDGKKVEKPTFATTFKTEIDKAFKVSDSSAPTTNASVDKFEGKFHDLCKSYNIQEEEIGELDILVAGVDEKNQEEFLTEMSAMLKESKTYCDGIQQSINYKFIVSEYIPKFVKYKAESSFSNQMLQMDKMLSIFVLISALFLFIMFIVIPVIIQIEENTRKN